MAGTVGAGGSLGAVTVAVVRAVGLEAMVARVAVETVAVSPKGFFRVLHVAFGPTIQNPYRCAAGFCEQDFAHTAYVSRKRKACEECWDIQ